ncbi:hypothetical protein FPQ18DRAFT_137057 [Pyronema domesticum]|uniref:MARVEL domain-containing protein n=1 Tax=Pyronema omphalodes (strain CBS 100304) TaxID=1076935 RepID=U4LSZ1_PYROM|nr:hypothetical protein FPQ18DRAFT_137057 [Pyronema domesticum]CCX32520.1 Protein of unknown function [Pyronema omphalodes CBS 100304]
MPSSPSKNTWKWIHISVRFVQITLAVSALAVFTHLLIRPAIGVANPKTEISVLLAFAALSVIQFVTSSAFTIMNSEKAWLAAVDLICLCGFVVTTVMTRGVTKQYGCVDWLSSSEEDGLSAGSAMIPRSIDGANDKPECGLLKGVFGIAICQSILVLASFQLVFYAIRARRNHDLRLKGLTEKSWRGDVGYRAEVAGGFAIRSPRSYQ